MHLSCLFRILAATGVLAQAAQAVPITPPGSQVLDRAAPNTLSNAETPANPESLRSINPEDQGMDPRDLVARAVITRYGRLLQGGSLLLASGAELVATIVSTSSTIEVSVPALTGALASSLDTIGIDVGQGTASPTGLQLAAGPTLSLAWSSANNQSPAITSLEWQTIVFSMYRVLTGSGIYDTVKAIFTLGQDTLTVTLSLSN